MFVEKLINTIVLFVFFYIIYIGWLYITKTPPKKTTKCIQITSVLYLSILVSVLIIPSWNFSPFYFVLSSNSHFEDFNYIPFKTIITQLSNIVNDIDRLYCLKNLIGNLFAFLPFPILIKLSIPQAKTYLCFFVPIVLIVLIECIQTKVGRVFDVDDIILNSLGAIVGGIFVKCNLIIPKTET